MLILNLINNCKEKLTSLYQMIPFKKNEIRIQEIDSIISRSNIWDDSIYAQNLMKERNNLSSINDKLIAFEKEINFYDDCLNCIPNELNSEINNINSLYNELEELEFKQLLNNPIDNSNAILTINSGAGGLESSNFVSILLRMYLNYAKNNGFKVEILDLKESEENSSICIDSVTISIIGDYAYGYLKSESGVHRFIRNSPFSSSNARHTSFVAVQVSADIDNSIKIEILDKDIEITTQTAGGPGGQSQNRCKSAIRLKYLPLNINIVARTSRDQLINRKNAFKILKSKLYDIELKKQQEEKDKNNNIVSNSFGHQIRSYILFPEDRVKDHRTGYEVNDSKKVLDGDIQKFIDAFLKIKA